MIYFDNAATSWPKPAGVMEAIRHCIEEVGANPGRSGHKMSLEANKLVTGTRERLAALFNIDDPERIVFTLNATDALNLAIKGLLKEGDHVITSSMEHNSVTGTLMPVEEIGALAKRRGLRLVVDAAQTAGLFNRELICMV